jgi:hypothetical protein
MSVRSKLTAYFTVRRMLKGGSVECGPVEAAVISTLAGFADPDGTNILQSYDSIAEVTRFSKAAVRRAVEYWRSLKILTLVKPGGGRGHAPEYALDLDRIEALLDKGDTPEHLSSDGKVPRESTKRARKVPKGALQEHPPSLPSIPAREEARFACPTGDDDCENSHNSDPEENLKIEAAEELFREFQSPEDRGFIEISLERIHVRSKQVPASKEYFVNSVKRAMQNPVEVKIITRILDRRRRAGFLSISELPKQPSPEVEQFRQRRNAK